MRGTGHQLHLQQACSSIWLPSWKRNCFLCPVWCSFEPLSSISLLGNHEGKMSTSLPTCPVQKGGEKSEVTPKPLQAQCPQLLLITHAFHLFYQLCCPPLDIVKPLEFFFNCWAQNWKKTLQMGLQQRRETSIIQ